MQKFLYILFIILMSNPILAQKQYNNWYFGDHVGITFNTNNGFPAMLQDSRMRAHRGTATISDEKGSLLFYSDGTQIWNREHEIMPNGLGLDGDNYAMQPVLIVKTPEERDLYYVFTIDCGLAYQGGEIQGKGLKYSLVDMAMDNGLGDVVASKKNITLLDSATGQCAAIKHQNGIDYWVITHEKNNNRYYIFLVNKYGVTLDHIDSIGSVYEYMTGTGLYPAELKSSISGTKIANSFYFHGRIEILDFDKANGKLSNPIRLEDTLLSPSGGIEFSPDESKLYAVACFDKLFGYYYNFRRRIYQINLNENTVDAMLSNMIRIDNDKDTTYFNALQIGPDFKIYATNIYDDYLYAIHNPNELGKSCNFDEKAVYVHYGKDTIPDYTYNVRFGLPNIIASDLGIQMFLLPDTLCGGEVITLRSNIYTHVKVDSYAWTGPNGFSSSEPEPEILNAVEEMSGWYKLQAVTNNQTVTDSMYILVRPKPIVTINPDAPAKLCFGGSVDLEALMEADGDYTFEWSNGGTTKEITVDSEGKYSVIVTNEFGCSDTSEIEVIEYPLPDAEIELDGTPIVCEGDSLELSASGGEGEISYKWSNGTGTKTIFANHEGYYSVCVTNENNCSDSIGIWIASAPKPEALIEIEGNPNICEGDTAILKAKPYGMNYTYQWQDGSKSDTYPAMKAGYYFCWVTNESGCSDSSGIYIGENPSHEASIELNGPPSICEGDSLVLSAAPGDGDYTYKWRDGEITQNITAKSEGYYYVFVINEYGCADSAGVWIETLPKPEVSIEPDGDYKICEGDSVLLQAKPGDGTFSYEWQDGSASKDFMAKSEGYYYAWVINENGCKDSAGVWIETIEPPDADIELEGPEEICEGDSVILKAMPEGVFSYKWQNGSDLEEISVSSPGVYSLAVTNENGCSDSASIEIKEAPSLLVSIDTVNARIGGKTNIIIRAITRNVSAPGLNIDANIHFDASAFLPDELDIIISNVIQNDGNRYLALRAENKLIDSDDEILFTISGTALLGGSSLYKIYIDDIIIEGARFCSDTSTGIMLSGGICRFDLRGVRQFEPVKININPNPSGEETEISVMGDYDGLYSLGIYNMQGEKVFESRFNRKSGSASKIKVPLGDLLNGLYRVIVLTEYESCSEPLIIFK